VRMHARLCVSPRRTVAPFFYLSEKKEEKEATLPATLAATGPVVSRASGKHLKSLKKGAF